MMCAGFKSSLLLGMGLLLVLSACKEQDSLPFIPSPEGDTADSPDSLSAFDTAQQLEQYLKKAIREQRGFPGRDQVAVPDGEDPPGEGGNLTPGIRGGGFSTTNLQEQGVDELDRLKSDGRFLFALVREEPVYSPLLVDPDLTPRPQPEVSRVRILELAEEPASAREIASIELDQGMRADGAYLLSGREGGFNNLLVVLGSGRDTPDPLDWFHSPSWRSGMTYVTLVDVGDPASPRRQAQLAFDGYLVGSRRIGEMLYLVTRYHPRIDGYLPDPESEAGKKRNALLLEQTSLAGLLPKWQMDEGSRQHYLTSVRHCFSRPGGSGQISADMISIIAIDLRNPAGQPEARCIIGPTETIYMSRQSLYLATARFPYVIRADDGAERDLAVYPPEETTGIHKFALAGGAADYRGSATVEGHLGWVQGKKAFRMGEQNDALFVVTSLGTSWGGTATTRLTVLSEAGDGEVRQLREIARLPNRKRPEPIGLPGERLYAARFLGDRGYLVTFRVTDPLYVLDLSEPADPFIAGSLKISGYSDYLHPVNENLLLGIGKSAVEADSEWGDGRGAWYQGIKLALFDVSDPQSPREIDSLEIGARGTDSEALRDHHAVAWLPAAPELGRPARLALPVALHASAETLSPTEPWQLHPWVHTGLYLFDIYTGRVPVSKTPGIALAGRIIAESADTGLSRHDYPRQDRALIKGNSVHYLHGNAIWSAGWGGLDSVTGPQ